MMRKPHEVITVKFLQVCPVLEAACWLKDERKKMRSHRWRSEENEQFERALFDRNDEYIDFALAKYGVAYSVAKALYTRGDEGIRCTILANLPGGGASGFGDEFEVASPQTANEFAALMSNPSLSNELYEQFFERKRVFESLTDDEFEHALYAIADNPRLTTPYDDSFLDGYSEYSHNRVFNAAWNLTLTVPPSPRAAASIERVLSKCAKPFNFDVARALGLWYPTPREKGERDWGVDLRTRIADLLPCDRELLRSSDPAIRQSFLRRFDPTREIDWKTFLTNEDAFYNVARNKLVWRSDTHREAFRETCWDFPDPRSNLDMPNLFNAFEEKMRAEHPGWFASQN
jgi:hypothetical protein